MIKERKLISMTEFVLEQTKICISDKDASKEEKSVRAVVTLRNITQYATFLRQPLELGMFIPCVDGKPIEEPQPIGFIDEDQTAEEYNEDEVLKYQQAKSKVLFEGFHAELIRPRSSPDFYKLVSDGLVWVSWNDSKTIENTLVKLNPTLTKTAIKQLGI